MRAISRLLEQGAKRASNTNFAKQSLRAASTPSKDPEYYKGLYKDHVAFHYKPMDLVIDEGQGIFQKTIDDKKFVNFFAAYSASNQGDVHPKITKAMINQGLKITLTSGAFYNTQYPQLAKELSETHGYDRILPSSGGAEANETALKIAKRIWHEKLEKEGRPLPKDPKDQAIIVTPHKSFNGRSEAVWPHLEGEGDTKGFGPTAPNRRKVEFNNPQAMQDLFEKEGKNIAAVLMEPVQGEGGVIKATKAYMQKTRDMCDKYGATMICDEIQTGYGRTGEMLAQKHTKVRGDVVTIAKALTGGVTAGSSVLADTDTISVIRTGDHGSTYGGNPLTSAVAVAATKAVKEEKLVEKSSKNGKYFYEKLSKRLAPFKEGENAPLKEIRHGGGLFIGMEFNGSAIPFRDAMIRGGVLCKQTQENTLRISPVLSMPKEALDIFVDMSEDAMKWMSQGKDLDELQLPNMSERLGKEHGIKWDENHKNKILTEVLNDTVSQNDLEQNQFLLKELDKVRNSISERIKQESEGKNNKDRAI